MGRGDRRTRRGKIARGSYGKSRSKPDKKKRSKKTTTKATAKKATKATAKKKEQQHIAHVQGHAHQMKGERRATSHPPGQRHGSQKKRTIILIAW